MFMPLCFVHKYTFVQLNWNSNTKKTVYSILYIFMKFAIHLIFVFFFFVKSSLTIEKHHNDTWTKHLECWAFFCLKYIWKAHKRLCYIYYVCYVYVVCCMKENLEWKKKDIIYFIIIPNPLSMFGINTF